MFKLTMNLIKILNENFSFQFSGRVNILQKVSKQYLGAIIQSDGKIVNATYLNLHGKKALASILLELNSSKNFSFVSEPEIINSSDFLFEMNENNFLKFKNDYFEQYEQLNKLRPNNELTLLVDPNKFHFNFVFSKNEFDVICSIIEHKKVREIYQNCELLDFDITTALISLRKKDILKVLNT